MGDGYADPDNTIKVPAAPVGDNNIKEKNVITIAQLKEVRFDLLEEVKTVNIGNEMAVTISIGVGLDGLTYAQNYEFARNAIYLALGRGGDQAVIKTPESIT